MMDNSQQPAAGFSDHVREQLHQAATAVPISQPSRGQGWNNRGRGRGQHYMNSRPPQHSHRGHPFHHNHHSSHGPHHPHPQDNNVRAYTTDPDSFPPLGASRHTPSTTVRQPQPPHQPYPSHDQYPTVNMHMPIPQPSQMQPQEHSFRGRGGPHRGRHAHHSHQHHHQHHHQPHPGGPPRPYNPNDFHRPVPVQRSLYAPTSIANFNSIQDQRALQIRSMEQSDYLNFLSNHALRGQITVEEQQAKENFRKELEIIAQKAIADSPRGNANFDPAHVKLKLYGSLGSGFGVAGSDMDLLLAFPQDEGPLGDIEIESRRILEKALLDAGIGARLLTNTRVPILRVCQNPNPELLHNLREYRSKWEKSLNMDNSPLVDEGFGPLPVLTHDQTIAAETALTNLDLNAHEVILPSSPVLDHAKLEYVGDCGIQCDINFSNYVALHNTRLLRAYCQCDTRVREVGIFVKIWAKARDINTPYRGTLSSYGYMMMVLHYLMHIANPPVIPNLQEMAKQKDATAGKTAPELVEGCDVRFVQDTKEVQSILQTMPRNHESVGSLLRGFFHYYADPRGFHWNHDVISIRSRIGRLTKQSKEWTGAKWAGDNQNVRLRYLLAIEDPFELEHNVGRTVGHSGIVAIRDEFRRAWTAVTNVRSDDNGRTWYWVMANGDRIDGNDLMSAAENRGDLLRKDQEFHKQKARKMRQEFEARERALQAAVAQAEQDVEGSEVNGRSKPNLSDMLSERHCR